MSGGYYNTASGIYASVSGGQKNNASGNFASILGGLNILLNIVNGTYPAGP